MKKFLITTGVALILSSTSAFAGSFDGMYDEYSGLNESATGTAFHQALYTGYRDLSQELHGFWGDNVDAELFNHKARSAGKESPIYPDEVMDRKIGDKAPTFSQALLRLKKVYERGGRELAAQPTAEAQVSFDCWIEATEDGKTQRASDCEARFFNALASAEAASNLRIVDITKSPPLQEIVADAPRPAPAPVVEYKPVPKEVLDQYFLVHFDFDSTNMTNEGRQNLAKSVGFLNEYGQLRINLTAHADRAGSDAYNRELSQRRADAVLTSFAQQGIDLRRVDIVEAVGESRSMVPTPDGQPHPDNRVVELKLKVGH